CVHTAPGLPPDDNHGRTPVVEDLRDLYQQTRHGLCIRRNGHTAIDRRPLFASCSRLLSPLTLVALDVARVLALRLVPGTELPANVLALALLACQASRYAL